MKTIPIGEATEAELRSFASDTLGIEIHPNAKMETVLAKVGTAWDKPDIQVPDNDPAQTQSGDQPQPVTEAQKAPNAGMVRLIIGVTEDAGGSDPIQLGVNGKIMLVPRGEEVEIPDRYFEVLEHAVMDKYDALPDGGMNPIPRKVRLYPFQRVA